MRSPLPFRPFDRVFTWLMLLMLCTDMAAVQAQIFGTPSSNAPNSLYLIAGGTQGSTDGAGPAAQFNRPGGVAPFAADSLYVVDTDNNTIRKTTSAAVVTTFAGIPGAPGSVDGDGIRAQFNTPIGITVDFRGNHNLYVTDTGNSTIRTITPQGTVSTLAGTAGFVGSADGTGREAAFLHPTGITIDAAKNLYVVDAGNATIRKITPDGTVTTFAGTAGQTGSADGTGGAAKFLFPFGITIDTMGNLFVTDRGNSTIRKITPARVVTTIAGTAGQRGSTDGTGTAARFFAPAGITSDVTGNLYVVDSGNFTVRKIMPAGVVTTIVGIAGVQGPVLGTLPGQLNIPYGVTIVRPGILALTDNNSVLGVNLGRDRPIATPPIAMLPFASFTPFLTIATIIQPDSRLDFEAFGFGGLVALGLNGDAFNRATDSVTLKIGALTGTLPAGSFKPNGFGGFTFSGTIGSLRVAALIQPQGGSKYLVGIGATGASLSGIANPVPVTLTIGNNTGTKSVTAFITRPRTALTTPPALGITVNPFGH